MKLQSLSTPRALLGLFHPSTWLAALMIVAVVYLSILPASAQTAPKVNLSCSPDSGVESVTPTCTWSTEGANFISCAASGGWTGNKAASGTEALPAVTKSTSFMLVCRTNDGRAVVSWTPPIHNTDGSAFTNLASFNVYNATSPTGLASATPKSVPKTVNTYTFDNLSTGPQYFAVTAVTTTGVQSAMSAPPGTKTITATTVTGAADVSVDTRPKPIAVTVN